MRIFSAVLFCLVATVPLAFASHAHESVSNFWQLHFSEFYGGNPDLPVVYVQAHVGEATALKDAQGRPVWDPMFGLVTLQNRGDHFYANDVIEHDGSPQENGGYIGAVVQYHYFLKGEESQIDSAHPFSGGHWTAPVIYANTKLLIAPTGPEYDVMRANAASALAQDANATSVAEVRYSFAD